MYYNMLHIGGGKHTPRGKKALWTIELSVWKKHSSGEEDPWTIKPSGHQTRGWRAASAAGLHGQGSRKRTTICYRHL